MRGKFITFEGIDGTGKSTQIRALAAVFAERGVRTVLTREPGGTPLGSRIRALLLDSAEPVAPLAELLLFAADRAQHVEQVIRPALENGGVVISDRYADATIAYQGGGRGFGETTVQQVIWLATGGLRPDLTIFLDLPVEEALSRTTERGHAGESANRMDREAAEFYAEVRTAYLKIASAEPERFRTVDASGSLEEVHARILGLVDAALADPLPL